MPTFSGTLSPWHRFAVAIFSLFLLASQAGAQIRWGGVESSRARSIGLPAMFGRTLDPNFAPLAPGEPSTSGTEFWITFPNVLVEAPTFERIYITSETEANVTVRMPGNGYANTVQVPAGGYAQVQLPIGSHMPIGEGTAEFGILITSDQPVTVYPLLDEYAACDACVALPAGALGTNYLVTTRQSDSFVDTALQASVFAVLAIDAPTRVTITPATTIGVHAAGVPYEVELAAGEVYQLTGLDHDDDLTGTRIETSRPVAVFAGGTLSNIPLHTGAANYLFEQLLPVNMAGSNFPIVPFMGRTESRYRVYATVDFTQVMVDGSFNAMLMKGQYYEFTKANSGLISTSQPSFVMQFANSIGGEANVNGDPTMTTVPPADRYLSRYIVVSPPDIGGMVDHYLTIIAPAGAQGSVQVDGVIAQPFEPIPGTGFYAYRCLTITGPHVIQAPPGMGIGVTAYGWGEYDGYSYPGGMKLDIPGISISDLRVEPDRVVGSLPAAGVVRLTGPAGPGGVEVLLSSGNPALATVPPSVSIPQGYSSAPFPVGTFSVTSEHTVTITASYGTGSRQTPLTVTPNGLKSITATPNPAVGGSAVQGTLTLAIPATVSATVTLASTNPALATLPSSVVFSPGVASKTFSITTRVVSVPNNVTIRASYGGHTIETVLQLVPVKVTGFVVTPTNTYESSVATAQVSLNGPAPAGGVLVKFTNSNPNAATVPASVTIPAGQSTKTVNLACKPVTTPQSTSITASFGTITLSQQLNVAPITLQSLSLVNPSVTGGTTATGILMIPVRAPAGGIRVTLTSGNTAAATVPATVTIAQNAQSVSFVITTKPVGSTTFVAVSGSRNGSTVSATLMVKPPELSSFTVSPVTVKGGGKVTGKVTLTGKAGPGGVTIFIQSNNSAAMPPSSVTVPANQTSVSFQIPTSVVSVNTLVQLNARSSTMQKSATLTVTH